MTLNNGHFIISLDFELHWGMFDLLSTEAYKTNLLGVEDAVTQLLDIADQYNIKLSFATVGLLMCKDKAEIATYIPKLKPEYKNPKFNAYSLIQDIGNNEVSDKYHYANSILKRIQQHPQHEIATHTFSHYYCNEDGQTAESFKADLQAAIAIAKANDIDLKSIVFPRNQINTNYFKICKQLGITAFRGNENHESYNPKTTSELLITKHRFFRFIDSYTNLSGYNTHKPEAMLKHDLIAVNSSRFLRPYSSKLSFLEPLKIKRITNAMTHAAKHNELFHLWWHPHNFGNHTAENFNQLKQILEHFKHLQTTYNFQSNTIEGLSNTVSKLKPTV